MVRKPGFSLVELVIVVVIIGVIAAIAVPRISRGAKGANESAVRTNLQTLRTAIDLYAAKHDGQFNLVTGLKEFLNMIGLKVEVMIRNLGTVLNFLYGYRVLMFLGFFQTFALLITVLAVIYHPAYWRIRVWRYFYQIQSFRFCITQSVLGLHNAQLLAFFINHTYLWHANLFVYACPVFLIPGD